MIDLARRAFDLTAFYSNDGLLPNHTVLWRPLSEWQFSFFFPASHVGEAAVGMLVCAVAYAMLLFGFKTKVAQVASLLCVLSLHTRTAFVNNGGDAVLAELTLLTAFLPTGRRYSLDALLARSDTSALRDDPTIASARAPVVSAAVLVLTLQLAAIYLFNALNKTGATWRDGSAVHYVLHQDGIVTWLGQWARSFVGLRASRVMTFGSFSIEAVLPILLLAPFARRLTRRLAVVLVFLLHLGFGAFLNLGVFVPAMMAFAVNFVPGEDLDALERFVARRPKIGERLRRGSERLRSVAQRFAQKLALEMPATAVVERRSRVVLLREVTVTVLGCLLGLQALLDNSLVTKLSTSDQPILLRVTTSYLQALQSWGMYAPDAPTTDTNVYVDAITVDGRHVDPFNEVASPSHPRPGATIPARLDQSVLFYAYALRIPFTPTYHPAFGEWIMRYPSRTGRENDRIVSFEAFLVEDDSPPPGAREPRNSRVKRFFQFPSP